MKPDREIRLTDADRKTLERANESNERFDHG